MARNTLFAGAIALVSVLAMVGCQNMPSAGSPTAASMPAFVPSNATPPTVTVASDELVGPVWQWQRTQLGSAPAVTAAAPERYTLSFQGGGRVSVRADCNRGSGGYEVNGAQIRFGAVALTKMACPSGSQDAEFLRSLMQANAYAMVKGELVLTLADGASMRFRGVP
jgi:heat shock protein HslJ